MSCEIRSTITWYALGSAIFTPPSFTNSAVTPSTFIPLTLSTKAGGKVFSMPNKIPIFFMIKSPVQTLLATPISIQHRDVASYVSTRWLKILRCHPLPQGPIMLRMIAEHIQPVRHTLFIQHRRHLHVLVQTHIPVRRPEHDLHLPPMAQKPIVAHLRHVIRRAIEIAIVVVVSVQKLVDVIGSAHAHTMGHYVRMLQPKVDCMIPTEAAPRHRQPWRVILPAQEGQEFMQNIAFILQMPQHALSGMNALVVPALCVHRIGTKHLQLSTLNLRGEHPDHAPIFVFEEPAHGCRKHKQRRPAVSEDQRFHVAVKFLAIASVIFTIHLSADRMTKYLT